MALSELDRDILYQLDFNAQATSAELSELLGVESRKISYRRKKLKSDGVIHGVSPFVDIPLLGYLEGYFYFSLSSSKKFAKRSFIQWLVERPEVVWIYECGGEFRYSICISAPELGDLKKVIDEIRSKAGKNLYKHAFGIRFNYRKFNRAWLSTKRQSRKVLEYSASAMPAEQLKRLNLELLSLLSAESDLSLKKLSDKLDLPVSTIDYQKGLLQEAGVIKSWNTRITYSEVGIRIVRIHLKTIGLTDRETGELNQLAESSPWITSIQEWVGNWDYLISVEVPTLRELGVVSDSIYDALEGSIYDMTSVFVQKVVKSHKYSF